MKKRRIKGTYISLRLTLILFGALGWASLQPATEPVFKDSQRTCAFQKAVFTAPGGIKRVTFEAEVASTPQQKQQGLMFREDLAVDQGMLFLWPYPQKIYMWMKNTFIPLDMIYIKADTVVGIIEAQETQSEAILTLPQEADTVFEVNLGLSKQHGITPGWRFMLKPCML